MIFVCKMAWNAEMPMHVLTFNDNSNSYYSHYKWSLLWRHKDKKYINSRLFSIVEVFTIYCTWFLPFIFCNAWKFEIIKGNFSTNLINTMKCFSSFKSMSFCCVVAVRDVNVSRQQPHTVWWLCRSRAALFWSYQVRLGERRLLPRPIHCAMPPREIRGGTQWRWASDPAQAGLQQGSKVHYTYVPVVFKV